MAEQKLAVTVRAVFVMLALVSSCVLASPSASAGSRVTSGFSVDDGRLLDANGNDFIMRGVNHPHSWFDGEMSSLRDIKATGANTARIVLSTGARFKRTTQYDMVEIISQCRAARLVCVLEVHDTTGYPSVDDSISLDAAVDYWIENLQVLRDTEAYVIVNLGNEPFDNERFRDWPAETTSAVQRMRQAGFAHTLMVDAPNWGQDWSFTMRDNARDVFDSDPAHNVVFDVHMYGVFNDGRKVRRYLESFVRESLPLVVGEFGATHTDGDPDEDAVMHWAGMYGIGYLAWSWSGNTVPVEDLNIVLDFDAGERTPWGERLLDGQRGIAQTSLEATVFGEPGVIRSPLLAEPPPPDPVAAEPPTPVLVDHVEAEDSVRNGLDASVRGAGFSGSGYLTGFDARGDSVTMTVHVETTGEYDLVFGYRSPYGDKTQQVVVNTSDSFGAVFEHAENFTTALVGTVTLRQGENRISVVRDWGWFDLDFVEIWAAPAR